MAIARVNQDAKHYEAGAISPEARDREKRILAALYSPATADEISARTSITPSTIYATLPLLVARGVVAQNGYLYSRPEGR